MEVGRGWRERVVTVLVSRDGSDWQTLVVNPLQDGPSTTVN